MTPTMRAVEELVGDLGGVVDAGDAAGTRPRAASFSRARVFDEFAEPMTTMASHRSASSISADCRFVVAKHRSLRPGDHTSGKRSRTATATPSQSRCDSVVWASRATGSSNSGSAATSATRSTRLIALGRDGHRADRLLVALVADVDDAVALAGAHPHLVVDLGDERAHRVDDVAAPRLGGGDDLGRRAVGRQHDRRARRDVGDVVDEHDALGLEALDDQPVVDDLVVAVHGRREAADHPGQRLDRHLDAGAEASWLGQEHPLDCHRAARLPTQAHR